jgi:hypothetical protein
MCFELGMNPADPEKLWARFSVYAVATSDRHRLGDEPLCDPELVLADSVRQVAAYTGVDDPAQIEKIRAVVAATRGARPARHKRGTAPKYGDPAYRANTTQRVVGEALDALDPELALGSYRGIDTTIDRSLEHPDPVWADLLALSVMES